jgi:hypothetical protein
MNNVSDNSPNLQSNKNTYADISNFLGRNSAFAQEYLSGLQNIAQNDPGEYRLDREELRAIREELYARQAAGDMTISKLMEELRVVDDRYEKTAQFDKVTHILNAYESSATIDLTVDDSHDVDTVNALLQRTTPIDENSLEPAPFEQYADNTGDAWRYVEDRRIRDYLLDKTFIADTVLSSLEQDNSECTTTVRNQLSATHKHFEVPTKLIVSAVGFGSWLGRDDRFGNQGMGEKEFSLPDFATTANRSLSLHAIKAYASHNSELPPVEEMAIYIQPDGLAYAQNIGDASHRIGAAILRGDETVKATELKIVLLKENHFSDNTASQL